MASFVQPPLNRVVNRTLLPRKTTTAKLDLTVYLVTDRRIPQNTTVESIVRAAVIGDETARATTVQLRDKNISRELTESLGSKLKTLCKETDTTFIVNDSIPLAVSLDADGVHLGQDDAPIAEARKLLGDDKIVGISVGSIEEALQAIEHGADYIGVGAVFKTGSKGDAGEPIGVAGLREIVLAVDGRIPVIAIGGINEGNVVQCRNSGADGVAVISAIMQSPSPGKASATLHNLFTQPRM